MGWRAIVQQATSVEGPWATVRKTSIQMATAHEDQAAPWGSTTKAVFTKLIMPWHTDSDPHNWHAVRIVVKSFWYRNDGSVRGWAKHRILGYRTKYGTMVGTADEFCPSDVFVTE